MIENQATTEVKVFDVYWNQGDSNKCVPLDIFQYKSSEGQIDSMKKNEENSDDHNDGNTSGAALINTGIGAKSSKLNKEFFDKIKNSKMKNKLADNIDLSIINKEDEITQRSIYQTPDSSCLTNTSNNVSIYGNDKWTSNIENAFLDSLRIIMKNGTYKIKIFNTHYGRNELISMYIVHKTGETRTKKQISSHIQVLKKAIHLKIKENINLDQLETEIYDLIINGAPATEETIKLFYSTFENIIKNLEKKKQELEKLQLLTPSTSKLSSINEHGLLSTESEVCSKNHRFIPTTPLEHAKMIYKNLKDYVCYPSIIYSKQFSSNKADGLNNIDNTSIHNNSVKNTTLPRSKCITKLSIDNNTRSQLLPSKSLLQLAKELEIQQKRLISNNTKRTDNSGMDIHQSNLISATKQKSTSSNFQSFPNIAVNNTNISLNVPVLSANQHQHQYQHQPQPYFVPYSHFPISSPLPLLQNQKMIHPHQQQQIPFGFPVMNSPSYSNFRVISSITPTQQFNNPNYGMIPVIDTYSMSSPSATVIPTTRNMASNSN